MSAGRFGCLARQSNCKGVGIPYRRLLNRLRDRDAAIFAASRSIPYFCLCVFCRGMVYFFGDNYPAGCRVVFLHRPVQKIFYSTEISVGEVRRRRRASSGIRCESGANTPCCNRRRRTDIATGAIWEGGPQEEPRARIQTQRETVSAAGARVVPFCTKRPEQGIKTAQNRTARKRIPENRRRGVAQNR